MRLEEEKASSTGIKTLIVILKKEITFKIEFKSGASRFLLELCLHSG